MATRGRNREARPTTANTKKSVNMSSKKRHPAFNRKHPAIGWFYIKKNELYISQLQRKISDNDGDSW